MEVRKATVKDVEKIYEIANQVEEFFVSKDQKESWPKETLKRWVLSKNDVTLVAEDKNKIIGFSFFALHIPTKKATFENLWVDPNYRGQNIASKLVKTSMVELKKLKCEFICTLVKTDNETIRKFLTKHGFQTGEKLLWIDKFLN